MSNPPISNPPINNPPLANPVNPPKKRGCLFYGCIVLAALFVVFGVLSYVGYRFAKATVHQWVKDYTETAPAPVEQVEISPAQLEALQKRLVAFTDALQNQKTSEELVLTPDEINALIAKDPNFKDFKDKLFVLIEDDVIKGKISLPLDDIGPLKLKGRYLNGTASFKVLLEGEHLSVRINSLEVKGKPLPAPVLAEFQKQNFAQEIQNNPEAAKTLGKFDSIQVKDGTLILKSKSK